MKSVLVVLMIAAHVIHFIPFESKGFYYFSQYVGLTSFSGFMFVFGFVCGLSYLNTSADSILWHRLSRHMIKTIIAFYISGIAFTVLVDHQCTFPEIIKILFFWKLPGFSEFLLSFALFYPLVFVAVLFKDKIKPAHLAFLCCFSLISTAFPIRRIYSPIISVFWGSTECLSFPIVQYLSYFLAGVYLSRKDKPGSRIIAGISFLGSLLFLGYIVLLHRLPSRFPPSLYWIVGGYAFVYLYYILCSKFADRFKKYPAVYTIGRNSLVFLVVSNLVIFSLQNFQNTLSNNSFSKVLFCLFCYASCILLSFLWIPLEKKIISGLHTLFRQIRYKHQN